MAVTAAFTDQAKTDFLNGVHQPGDTYKCALYLQSGATLDKTTTVYTSTGEVSSSGTNYTAGGATLTGFTVGLSGDTAYLSFTSPTWPLASFTADAALIWNSTRSSKAIAVLTFVSTTAASVLFTLSLPVAGASAVITVL